MPTLRTKMRCFWRFCAKEGKRACWISQLMAGTLTPAEEFARLREAIGRSVSERTG